MEYDAESLYEKSENKRALQRYFGCQKKRIHQLFQW